MKSSTRWRQRHTADERGATMVELAFILPLFILLIFGLLEFGLMFRERMTIASATQSAARTGATMGTSDEADFRILQALEEGLVGQVDPGVILTVDIFKANPVTGEPLGPRDGYVYDGSVSGCKWDPCPDPTLATIPFGSPATWPPSVRDTILEASSGGGLDVLGVEVVYRHSAITNVLPYLNRDLTERALVRLEPDLFGSAGP